MEIEEVVQLADVGQPERSVVDVPIGNVITNPFQPRKVFETAALQELADSINQYGILQPLLVIPLEEEQYLLIAGERRLRAAYIADLETVPVLLGNYSSQEVAEIAMIENLQREDLHFFDEAFGYELLMREFGITQEDLAKRVGKKQSTIANKLRTIRLPSAVRDVLRSGDLTERHARALLKLDNEEDQLRAVQAVKENDLNVRQTEELVAGLLAQVSGMPASIETKTDVAGKRTKIIRDVRIFVNSIKKIVGDIKKAGGLVQIDEVINEDEVVITLRMPTTLPEKKAKKKKAAKDC